MEINENNFRMVPANLKLEDTDNGTTSLIGYSKKSVTRKYFAPWKTLGQKSKLNSALDSVNNCVFALISP